MSIYLLPYGASLEMSDFLLKFVLSLYFFGSHVSRYFSKRLLARRSFELFLLRIFSVL